MTDSSFVIDDLNTKTDNEREVIAAKVGKSLSLSLGKVERVAVEELARAIAVDAAESVRRSLVKEVLKCPYLPIDVAKQIANDVSSISEDFLHNYEANDDDELEQLARDCEEHARELLATRRNLPEPASFAISELGQEKSISNLMENNTAVISERICSKVVDRFKDNEAIMEGMSKREDLPLNSISIIVEFLAEEVATGLVKKYDLGEDLAHFIAGQAKLSTMDEALSKVSSTDLVAYYEGLKVDGLLNNGMLLQAIQSNDINKFAIAVSVRSGIDLEKINKILESGDKGHFFRLMDKMKVAEALAAIIHSAYLEALHPFLAEDENDQAS